MKLRLLADTVLSSAKPAGETITSLRAAGYAPVRSDALGETVVERIPVRRAEPPQRPRGPVHSRPPADLAALARRLAGSGPQPQAEDLSEVRAEEASALTASEIAVLDFAIRHRLPVLIDYVNAEGGASTRVVEPTAKLGPVLVAWCHLRHAERNFAMSRITAASPVAQ